MGRKRLYPGELPERRRLSKAAYRQTTGSMDLKKTTLRDLDVILKKIRARWPSPEDEAYPYPPKSRADVIEYLIRRYNKGLLPRETTNES